MTSTITAPVTYRLPAGLLGDTRAAADDLSTTTTGVVIAALEAHLAAPSTPQLLAAGRLIEVEQLILTGDATSTPWELRMPEPLRTALTAYVVGTLALTEALAQQRANAAQRPSESSASTTEALRQAVLSAALVEVASVVPGLTAGQIDVITRVLGTVEG